MIIIDAKNNISKITNLISEDNKELRKINDYIESIRSSKLSIQRISIGYSIESESFVIINDSEDPYGTVYLIGHIDLSEFKMISFKNKIEYLKDNFYKIHIDLLEFEFNNSVNSSMYKVFLDNKLITWDDLPEGLNKDCFVNK